MGKFSNVLLIIRPASLKCFDLALLSNDIRHSISERIWYMLVDFFLILFSQIRWRPVYMIRVTDCS